MSKSHVIQSLKFEIKGLDSNSEYHRFADRIGAIVRSSLSSRLERLLNNYSVKGYHVVFNKIEVDIGKINTSNLENNILVKIEKFLEKELRSLKNNVEYKIRNNNFDFITNSTVQQTAFYKILKEKSNQYTGSVRPEISDNILDYFPNSKSKTGASVVPNEAKFLESVVFFLEYGFLPRHLFIPLEYFDSIFASIVIKYQDKILSYFRHKSPRLKKIILDRMHKQIDSNELMKNANSSVRRKSEQLLKSIHQEKLQLVHKALHSLSYHSTTPLSKELVLLLKDVLSITVSNKKIIKEQAEIIKLLHEKSDSDQLKLMTSSQTELDTKIKDFKKKHGIREIDSRSTEFTTHEKDEFISGDTKRRKKKKGFDLTDKEKFLERLEVLLNQNDRSAFNELLETDFVKSLATSYESKTDSVDLLTRSFMSIILYPKNKKRLFSLLPAHIDTERELINQLYKRSPIIIASTIKALKSFVSSRKKHDELIIGFLKILPKHHINLILKSFVTNYSNLSTTLNFLNRTYSSSNLIVGVVAYKQSHIKLIVELVNITSSVNVVIREFINKEYLLLELRELKQNKSLNPKVQSEVSKRFEEVLLKVSKVHDRKYTRDEKLLLLAVENISKESSRDFKSKKELVFFQFETMLEDFYIPFSSKKLLPSTVSSLIVELEKESVESDKDFLVDIFKSSKVLKNSILKNISKKEFSALLITVLPTTEAREILSLFDKYIFIWKQGIDEKQVQLIFLSMLREYKEINEYTIFSMFFTKLKIYKAYTHDVQKKHIINNFERNSDRLTKEVKDTIIEYIDAIPVMESLKYKETKNKLAEGIPIKNAGLVLLWPFFKTLFQLTGLINKDGEFNDMAARERGALLLQYIAVKSSKVVEPYLTLNKVITGFPLEDAISSEIVLTEKEKDISEALLLNVIQKWPSFEKSSVDNLRGSFLIRDGILSYRGEKWILKVDNKAYDILLKKLPWGYSMLRLTWIPYLIKVEWN